MRVCPKCGHQDSPLWCGSRFDFNANYMRFSEAMAADLEEIKDAVEFLKDKANFVPFMKGDMIYYRRGTGGLYLYRVSKEDFKVSRERKQHKPKKKLKEK